MILSVDVFSLFILSADGCYCRYDYFIYCIIIYSAVLFMSLIFTQLFAMTTWPWWIKVPWKPHDHPTTLCPQVILYSEPDFGGECQVIDRNQGELSDRLLTKSCRVSGGRWEASSLICFKELAVWVLKSLPRIKTGEVNISFTVSAGCSTATNSSPEMCTCYPKVITPI